MTERLATRIRRDFRQTGNASEVLCLVADVSGSERVQAAVVLTAGGNMEHLRAALDLARTDWRDVLMNGGLGNEDWEAVLDRELGQGGSKAN